MTSKPLNIILSLGGILSALLVCELLIRVTGSAPEVGFIQIGRYRIAGNKKIGYEPIPHLDYHGDTLDFYDYRGETNQLGYRDAEHSIKKKPGVIRIVILGDSITAGWGIAKREDTFPYLLEQTLLQQGIPAEVMNFGVSGYNTQQAVETLKAKGLQFQPDIVLLVYCLNDTEHTSSIMAALVAHAQQETKHNLARLNPLLAKSALYRYLRFQVLKEQPTVQADSARNYYEPTPNHVETYLAELAHLSKKHHFKVIVAVFPYFDNLTNYQHSAEHTAIQQLTNRHGFTYIDLLEPLRHCAQRTGQRVWRDMIHPNEVGHRCVAEAVKDLLPYH